MSPTVRGALIPRLLQERSWQLPELADRLGVSPAQLRRDLHAVRSAGWVISEDVAHLGYAGGHPKALWIATKEGAP